jgi:hypothetical protein
LSASSVAAPQQMLDSIMLIPHYDRIFASSAACEDAVCAAAHADTRAQLM